MNIDLLQPDIFRSFTAKPERLREIVDGNPGKSVVLIDEVQKAPSLLSVVHALLEERHGLQFILTGSSACKLKRTGVDLLAGRALLESFHPFMAGELQERFSLDRALQIGLLPLVWASENPQAVLRAYHGLYLREEVQMEALVRDIGPFSRFLEAVSFSHGAVLNLSNVARECEVGQKTVVGYLDILEDLLLAFRVPVFHLRAQRQMVAHPKFYFFDAGVFRAIRPSGPLDRVAEMEGPALEGLVVQHLRAWNAYRGQRNTLYYWRTRSGVEVDIIVYGQDGLWALEVKNSRKIGPQDLRALKAFKEDYPEAKAILLYRGDQKLKQGDVFCLPCDAFLKQLHPGKNILS